MDHFSAEGAIEINLHAHTSAIHSVVYKDCRPLQPIIRLRKDIHHACVKSVYSTSSAIPPAFWIPLTILRELSATLSAVPVITNVFGQLAVNGIRTPDARGSLAGKLPRYWEEQALYVDRGMMS
jgi:hypothetical protein